jgi:hypothetical protein
VAFKILDLHQRQHVNWGVFIYCKFMTRKFAKHIIQLISEVEYSNQYETELSQLVLLLIASICESNAIKTNNISHKYM